MLQFLQTITLVSAPALMVFAASYDFLTMTIPNRLSIALAGLFVVCALLVGPGWLAVGLHLAAGFLVLSVGIGLFAGGFIGGGDAKFAAAIALWVGFGHLLEFIFVASLAGGALALMVLALRRLPLPVTAMGWAWLARLHNPTNGIPYGVALAVGGLVVLPRSPLWIAAFGG